MSMSDMKVQDQEQHIVSHDTSHMLHMAMSHPVTADMESVDDSGDIAMHEHDAADCEEHCASCSNHCSSLGIVTSTQELIDLKIRLAGTLSSTTSNHFELLFRPPILA